MVWDEEWVAATIAAAALISGLLIIWNIVLSVKFARLKQMLKRWTGDIPLSRFDETVSAIQEDQFRIRQEQRQLQTSIGQLNEKIRRLKGHVGVLRYNAFEETGNDLSFSVAVVDDQASGVVLSGIRNREETYVYVKPLEEGQSKYALTPEEKEAIHRALQS